MNILLTGGAGYIGNHTAIELIAQVTVLLLSIICQTALDRHSKGLSQLPTRLFPFMNLISVILLSLNELFTKESIDGVIHFAGLKSVGESVAKPIDYYRNNLDSTLSLLEVMQKHSSIK
jgi:UDP-glucose 4-epimerase